MTKDNQIESLDSSIPANNQKIVEVYNKMRSNQLIVNKGYQRKLVWKQTHKINFIDTILLNFPFPEVYLAPGSLDQEKLILVDEIVDGQQRLKAIRDYIEGTDIFALPTLKNIKKFSELSSEERTRFLNYEISVRYLKSVTEEQVREIFQRINKTDYGLNATERLNAQWGGSEFVCFAKQIIEKEFDLDTVLFKIPGETRQELGKFFHGEDDQNDAGVFSDNDMSRMFALQYIMTLIATMDSEKYLSRNEKIKSYIEGYNENFPQAVDLLDRLLAVTRFINKLNLRRDSRWFKKANLFSLIIELDKVELSNVNPKMLSNNLTDFDFKATMIEFKKPGVDQLTPSEEKYLTLAREAVNEKSSREFRGEFIKGYISSATKKV